MAIKTVEQSLEEVQTAITAILSGVESYTIDGNSFRRSDLGSLQEREAYLQNRYAQTNGKKPRVSVAKFGSVFSQ